VKRGALVGCGFIAPRHLTAWRQIESVRIEALCDKDRGRAQAMAERFGVTRVFTTFEDVLEECELDFIDLASGPETHLRFATQAADAGLDVLLQKPFADTPENAEQIVRLASARGRTIAVNEMWKWMPAYQAVREMLGAGALGNIERVRFHKFCNLALIGPDGGVPPFLQPGQQSRFRTMPQLILFEYGVHLLDVLRSWFGEGSVRAAFTSRISPHIVGEDAAFVELWFDGIPATLNLDWSVPGPEVTDPLEHERLTIVGSQGHVIVEGARLLTHVWGDGQRTIRGFDDDPRAGGFLASQTDFARALERGTAPASTVADNIETLRLLWQSYSVAALGVGTSPAPCAARDQ
jgi:D-apiose dehydrogenase